LRTKILSVIFIIYSAHILFLKTKNLSGQRLNNYITMYWYYSTEQAKIRIKRVISFFTKAIECLIGSVCRRTRGWGNDTFFSFFPFLIFKRREKFCGKPRKSAFGGNGVNSCGGGCGDSLSLKPLFLAAAADAVNFYEFLIKYVRALL